LIFVFDVGWVTKNDWVDIKWSFSFCVFQCFISQFDNGKIQLCTLSKTQHNNGYSLCAHHCLVFVFVCLFVCVCISVFFCVCICVCLFVFVLVCLFMFAFVFACLRLFVCVCLCL